MTNRSFVQSAVIRGVDAVPVSVECSISDGLPSCTILGVHHDLADELQAIVRCSILASGYTWPQRAVTVSLAPVDMPKRGVHLSLPVAVAILAASGQIRVPQRMLYVGELSLTGNLVQATRGIVAYARLASDLKATLVCLSSDALPSDYIGIAHGITGLDALRTMAHEAVQLIEPDYHDRFRVGDAHDTIHDFILDDMLVRRDVLLVTTPDYAPHVPGAVLEASTALTPAEALDCAAIYSAAGESGIDRLLGLHRPVRMPDPSISLSGLLGGGMPVRPGEIALAHNGILLLDHLEEWKPSTLRQIAAAKRDGHVRIVRQEGAVEMPADFQLIGVIPPCPCGWLGHPTHECRCEPSQAAAWQRRIDAIRPLFGMVASL